MASARQVIEAAVIGLTSDAQTAAGNSQSVARTEPVKALAYRRIRTADTDAGTAGNAIGEKAVFTADSNMTVRAIYFTPGIAITADGTNNATITVSKRPASAPASPVAVATNSTNTTDTVLGSNAVAFTQYGMTLSSTVANLNLVAGDVLTFKATKAGTGVALGAAVTATGASFNVDIVVEEGAF